MESITVRHQNMTVGELKAEIEANERPVRRSAHAGNIPPKDLAVMAGLPKGVTVILVDTIKGDDKVTKPFVVRLGEGREVKLTSKSAASERVIGSVAIHASQDHDELPITPNGGQSIGDYHSKALSSLNINNSPVDMMHYFSGSQDMLSAAMKVCCEEGLAHRVVKENGKIASGLDINHEVSGVYGVDDVSGRNVGALLPLPGMMALETLLGELEGSDETLHLAGGDMTHYTGTDEMMGKVDVVHRRVAAELGIRAARHRYLVQNIQNLASFTSIVSQHDMAMSGKTIDLEPHLCELCGVTYA